MFLTEIKKATTICRPFMLKKAQRNIFRGKKGVPLLLYRKKKQLLTRAAFS